MKGLQQVVLLGTAQTDVLHQRLAQHLRDVADVTRELPVGSAHVVISACSSEDELRELVLGPEGLFGEHRAGLVYVDLSWIGESLSIEIARAASAASAFYVRAPITDGPAEIGSRSASTAMVSGVHDALEAAQLVLEGLADRIVHFGEAEEARAMTAVLDVLTGVTFGMWAEALVFGEAAGLIWTDMVEVMETSAIASPMIKDHAQRVSRYDYESTVTCAMIGARLEEALARGKSKGVVLTLTGLAHQMFVGALGSGATASGATSVIPWLEAAAGMQPTS
jgi:3-hydroxyisobutyrate dehydrogenase-like beta-hydroxyacid dehydrogenase